MLDAADFRAALAKARIPIYVIAPRVGVHPARLGRMLNEKVPIPSVIAARLKHELMAEERSA